MKTDYTYRAFCHSCYDGDTFTMTIDLGFNVQVTEKIRLFGVDTPEIRGDERERGLLVRDYVRSAISGKFVTIKTHKDKKGKYGRYLAELIFENSAGVKVDLAEDLLSRDFAEKVNY